VRQWLRIHFALSRRSISRGRACSGVEYIGSEEPRDRGRDRQCGEPRLTSAFLRKVGSRTDPTIPPPFDGLKLFRLLPGWFSDRPGFGRSFPGEGVRTDVRTLRPVSQSTGISTRTHLSGRVWGADIGAPILRFRSIYPASTARTSSKLIIFCGLPTQGCWPSQEIPQPSQFDDVLCREDGADQVELRCGMNFVQVVLAHRLCHELPHALIQGPLRDEVGACAKGSTDTLVLYRRPFPERSRSVKIYLNVVTCHNHQSFYDGWVAVASQHLEGGDIPRFLSSRANQLIGTDDVSTTCSTPTPRFGPARPDLDRCSARWSEG
jgi:hypothetical protein